MIFGVLRYRDRKCGPFRLRAAREFRDTLSFTQSAGVLAKVAHHAFFVATGLSLHSAWRLEREHTFHIPQFVPNNAARWTLARGELELCHLGSAAWRRTRGRSYFSKVAREPKRSDSDGGDRWYRSHISLCLFRVDIFRAKDFSHATHLIARFGEGTLSSPNLSTRVLVTLAIAFVMHWAPRAWLHSAVGTFSKGSAVRAGLAIAAFALILHRFAAQTTEPFVYGQF